MTGEHGTRSAGYNKTSFRADRQRVTGHELVSTTTSAPAVTFGRTLSPIEQDRIEHEVSTRVEASSR